MRFKQILLIIMIFSLFLLPAVHAKTQEAGRKPSSGPDSILSEQEKRFLAKAGPIRVHNESDWAPFNFNQKGVPKGFSIDYIKLVAQKTGFELKIVSGPSWNQFLDMIRKGELDVMLNIAVSPERRKFLEFTPPYVTMVQMLYTRKDFPVVSSIKDLDGKRFAVPKGFFLHEVLKEYPGIKIVEVSNTSEAIRAVSTGKADALFDLMPIVDYITGQLQITNLKVGGDIGLKGGNPIPLHIAVSKDKKILAGIIEKGMERITGEELRKLHEKWLSGSSVARGAVEPSGGVRVHLTPEERAFIAGKQLRLGVDVDRPPFEYIDEKGVYTGISAEFILAAAKCLGITVLPQKDITWPEAMEKIKTGRIDVIPKVTPSAARAKFMIFTTPYATFPSVIVTRKDRSVGKLADLRGLRVGVNKGQIVETNLKREYPELMLDPYPDIEKGLRALSTGKCDAYVDNLGAVAYTIDTVGLPNLRIAAPTPYTHDLAFGIRKDWPLMASALEKALAAMTDQEKAKIKDKWLSIKYGFDIPWHIIAPVGIALLVIIAFVLIWNRRLERAVRERERSEQKIKAMGEAMADALIMIDDTGKVLFWSNAAERLFGYTVTEAMGMDVHDIVVPDVEREKARKGIRQFAISGQGPVLGAAFETNAVNRMGGAFPVEVNLSSFKIDDRWFAVGTVRDITERRKAEEAIKESEERIRLIFSSMSEGIFGLDKDGVVTFVNPTAAAMLGYSVDELVGQAMHEKAHHSYVNGAGFPQLQCPMYMTSQDGKVRNTDSEVFWRKDGTFVQVEYTTTPVLKNEQLIGTVVSFRDITERKRMEQEIIAEGQRLKNILDTAPISITISSRGIVRFANPLFTSTFGVKVGDESPQLYVDPGERDAMIERLRTDGVVKSHETRMYDSDGQVLDILATYMSVSYEGEEGVLGWLLDITESKEAEKALKQYVEELERFGRLTINREEKMIQLKEEVNALLEQGGEGKKYKIVE